jgi:hypothetical protein
MLPGGALQPSTRCGAHGSCGARSCVRELGRERSDVDLIGKAVTQRQIAGSNSCGDTISLHAQKVINATGSVPASRVNDPLLSKLVERGLIRLDRNRLGIDVTERFAVLRPDGQPTSSLWGIGPIREAHFGNALQSPTFAGTPSIWPSRSRLSSPARD